MTMNDNEKPLAYIQIQRPNTSLRKYNRRVIFFLNFFLNIYEQQFCCNKKKYYNTEISTNVERCLKIFLLAIKKKKRWRGAPHKLVNIC